MLRFFPVRRRGLNLGDHVSHAEKKIGLFVRHSPFHSSVCILSVPLLFSPDITLGACQFRLNFSLNVSRYSDPAASVAGSVQYSETAPPLHPWAPRVAHGLLNQLPPHNFLHADARVWRDGYPRGAVGLRRIQKGGNCHSAVLIRDK